MLPPSRGNAGLPLGLFGKLLQDILGQDLLPTIPIAKRLLLLDTLQFLHPLRLILISQIHLVELLEHVSDVTGDGNVGGFDLVDL